MVKAGSPKVNNERERSATRLAILRAARRVFLEKGYEGTSMDLVASESGAGRRTVYNHFSSKKELFDAMVSFLWEGMPLEKIVSRSAQATSPEEALTEIGNAIADFWAPDEAVAFARLVISEGGRFPELVDSFLTFGRVPARRAVVSYLKSLTKSKVVKIPDAEFAAAQFIALINSLLLWNRVIDRSVPPSKERREFVVSEAVKTIMVRYRP